MRRLTVGASTGQVVRALRRAWPVPGAHDRRALELFRRLLLLGMLVTGVLRQVHVRELHLAAQRLSTAGAGFVGRLVAWFQADFLRFSCLNLAACALAAAALSRRGTRSLLIALFLVHAVLVRAFAGLANQGEVVAPWFLVFLLFVDFRSPRQARRRAGRPLAEVRLDYLRNLLALRGLQLQLALLYVFNGLAKLAHPEWREGRALADVFSMEWVMTVDLRWVADHPLVLRPLTYTVLLYELLFPLWMATSRTRRQVVFLGVAIHLGIALAMNQLVGLSLVTAAALVLYHYPDATVRRLSRRRAATGG